MTCAKWKLQTNTESRSPGSHDRDKDFTKEYNSKLSRAFSTTGRESRMKNKEELIRKIRQVFRSNDYPGDALLVGSTEGCEAYDEVAPFRNRTDWTSIEPSFLDAHSSALSFFSEAGLRFFLPAYLTADLQGQLKSADPVVPLTHGFSDIEVRTTINNREFVVRTGKSELVNPRRYGAGTFYDYAQFRLSIFTREEAQVIVSYLEYKRDFDWPSPDRERIDAALDGYWRSRAMNAPTNEDLRQHLRANADFIAASKEPQ